MGSSIRIMNLCVIFLWLQSITISHASTLTTEESIDNIRFSRLLDGTANKDTIVHAVHATLQDEFGFIWFAGEHGLARYDGHEIKHYYHDPKDDLSLPSNVIWDAVIDAQNVLWLATQEGLARYHPESNNFTRYLHDENDSNSLPINAVRSLAVDPENNLLIGTLNGLCVLDAARKKFTHYSSVQPAPYQIPDSNIQALHADTDGTIWVGTGDAGLLKIDRNKEKTTQFLNKLKNPHSLPHNFVTTITRDYTGKLWVGTFGGGAAYLKDDESSFKTYRKGDATDSLRSNTIWQIFEDSRKRLWFAIDHGGLSLLNREEGTFYTIEHNPYDSSSLISNNSISIFEDKQHNLWVGAYPIGISYHNSVTANIKNLTHLVNDSTSLSDSAILTVQPSQDGHLWIGTENGLNIYDPENNQNQRFDLTKLAPDITPPRAVLTVTEDDSGNLWIGTWSGGLYCINRKTKDYRHFMPDGSENALNSAFVWDFVGDEEGLWIGTETGGLNYFDYKTKTFRSLPFGFPANEYQTSNAYINTLLRDHAGDLWIGTRSGLDRMDANTQRLSHYYYDADNPDSLINNNITALHEDTEHRLWIGTRGGGVSILDKTRTHFQSITTAEGLTSNNVASITQDKTGNLWITTDKGTSHYHFKNLKITPVLKSQGLAGDNFKRNATFVDASGRIYLGATDGLSILRADSLTPPKAAEVIFTGLSIFHDDVDSRSENSPLPKTIASTTHMTLNYDQRVITLRFSSLDFQQRDNTQYRYYMKGLDKSWGAPTYIPKASYANLPSGKYQFNVIASNAAGEWSTHPATLDITVLPPYWRTLWAYNVYAAIMLFIGYLIWHYQNRRLQLRKERMANAQLVKLDEMKDAFLANTSHELRTPLNGIIGLAEALQTKLGDELDAHDNQRFDMIIQSGRRLAHLVNDILDMAKLNQQKITLHLHPVDLEVLIDTVISLVTPLIGKKPITLEQKLPANLLPVAADDNRLQQVMINLIGNAIKYSDQGLVTISITQTEELTSLTVKDQGIGISEEDCANIFNSFSQVEQDSTRAYEGTGLGLSITQQLVELHGSQLEVQSRLGEGSAFSFTLATVADAVMPMKGPSSTTGLTRIEADKKVAEALDSPPLKDGNAKGTNTKALDPEEQKTNDSKSHQSTLSATILSVDDNPINLMVLGGILGLRKYTVIEASDGQEAVEKIIKHPEINMIIMDVMMPCMNGYDACEAIRNHRSIDDLPIVFLTAKHVDDEYDKAISVGGNDIITKPVNKEQLLKLIDDLLPKGS